MKGILVETSARHVHVTEESLKILFGADAKLSVKKELSQPGQYASNEKVDLVGPKNTIKGVSILGPVRGADQVEVSLTDARTLGVVAPVRESGDIAGSEKITIIGPNGSVEKKEGCIIATRHIHATKEDMEKYGLDENKKYLVKIGGIKGGIIGGVSVKVSDKYYFEMHVDTDDANAHLIDKSNNVGTIIGEDNESI